MFSLSKRMQEFYDFYIKERCHFPTQSMPVPQNTILKWQDKLPNALLYIWQELGWCTFQNGLLWVVNPDDYQYITDTWLQNTQYQQMDTWYCIARTAFGKCILYGVNTKHYIQIMPQYNTIWADDKQLSKPQDEDDVTISLFLKLDMGDGACDMLDCHDNPLFERAFNKLGALSANEMYAFKPFLMLLPDEKITIDNLIKVHMNIYTDMLYQFREPTSRGTYYSDIFK